MTTVRAGVAPADRLDDVAAIIERLDRTDLHPSAEVNALFTALVRLSGVISGRHPVIQDAVALARIRMLCARGETYLEEFWVREILREPGRLAAFPYLDNYRTMSRAEHHALTAATSRPLRHIVFAGCGPLPLTALELHRIAPHLQITCLDTDPTAANRAQAVIHAVAGPCAPIAVVCADAADHDYSDADAILVAALVGATPAGKLDLLQRIATSCPLDATLAARSVPDDGRQLLYTRLDPTEVAGIHGPAREWLPPLGVINSLILMGGHVGAD